MKPKNLITVIALILVQFTFSQTVYTVDNRPESGAQYTSVQAAIDAASAGDIIYIHPSPADYLDFTINKTLTIVGSGHDPANSSDNIRSVARYIYLSGTCDGTVITGMYFSRVTTNNGTSANNLHLINNRITSYIHPSNSQSQNDGWIIEGNWFSYSYSSVAIDLGYSSNFQIRNNVIYAKIGYADQLDVITNNLFINTDPSGGAEVFYNTGGITSPIVTNNMFVFTDPDITALTSTGTAIVYTNCLTWQAGGGVALPALPGSGNLDNTDPQFVSIPTAVTDFYNNDYNLNGASAAVGAATDGGDIGIFGRNFPFDTAGRPHSMPYPEAMTILNTVVQPGQDLTVEFQASQKN